jgi:hypothetical protein
MQHLRPVALARPRQVVIAVRFMRIAAGLTAIFGIIAVITSGRTFRASATAAAAVVFALLVGLWLLIAWGCARGRRRSRLVGTIVFALLTVYVVSSIAVVTQNGGHGSIAWGAWGGLGLAWLTWSAALAAVTLLWRAESREYFRVASAKEEASA